MIKIVLCATALLLCAACAPSPMDSKRYFWPPSAEQAKIEYINFYETDRDVLRGYENHLAEAIFGIEQPSPLFGRPVGIGADGKGRVFVTDPGQGKVLVLDLRTGEYRALRNKDGLENGFSFPYDIAFVADGRSFISDSVQAKIFIYDAAERPMGAISSADLKRPTGIAVDSLRQKIYVVDTGKHHLIVFDFAGNQLQIIGGRGGGKGTFNYPLDVEVDGEGNIYVLDSVNCSVQKFDAEGNFLLQFGERGTAQGSFQMPKSLAISPSGHLYVTDGQKNSVIIFDLAGQYLLSLGGRYFFDGRRVAPGGFNMPHGVAVGSDEAIWIVDSMNRLVHHLQYLDADYLAKNPIRPEEVAIPPAMKTFGLPLSPAAPNGGTAQ